MRDGTRQNSVADSVGRLFWSAAQVRERLSRDHWQSLTRLQRDMQADSRRDAELGEILIQLDQLIQVSSSLTGFTMDNMTRDTVWRVLRVGRRIERLHFFAGAVSAFLRTVPKRNGRHLEWLLELTDSIITYRSRYARTPELMSVIDLVVLDESNPHSVIFQVNALERYLNLLKVELGDLPEAEFREASAQFRGVDLQMLKYSPAAGCLEFAKQLALLEHAALELSDRIGMRFFTHVDAVSHQTLAR